MHLPTETALDKRTILSDYETMTGNEFIKRIRRLAKQSGTESRVDQKRGKGSHVTLYYGDRFTIVRQPNDELKTGTFSAMLKQLGLTKLDIR